MWHTFFIAVHAAAGGIAFVAGCVAIGRRALFGTYWWSLVVMELFLVLAIAVEWTVLDAATRAVFAALAGLGLLMLWRAERARRSRPGEGAGPSAAYVGHVGFTLIALVDAFVVVTVINLGSPGWLVGAAAVAIAVAGHLVLRTAGTRLVTARS